MGSVDIGYNENRFTNAVPEELHCVICRNILKEPVQCRRNEHHFCSPCIRRYLEKFQACPCCTEELTLDTLRQPSKFLTRNLSNLVIRCDYVDQGCTEAVLLPNLDAHAANCDFSPVECSNEGCSEMISKQDRTYHENETCQFRPKCVDCKEARKDIEEMKRDLKELQGQMSRVLSTIDYLTHTVKTFGRLIHLTLKEDIIIVGGRGTTSPLNSAEMFTWSKREWIQLQPTKEQRAAASSVVYENAVIIMGGQSGKIDDNNSMEALKIDDNSAKWDYFPSKLPRKLSAHKSVIYKNRLFVIGGCNQREREIVDCIYEVSLTPRRSYKLVSRMPQPVCFHGAELFGHKILIFGGFSTTQDRIVTDNVVKYDIERNECTRMPALPFPLGGAAAISWENNAIIIGGNDVNGVALDTAIMYDVDTGKTKMLPNMKYKREGCSAVIVQSGIVVMGGRDENMKYLNSVESFSFDSCCWEELTPMIEPRSYATAVVKRGNFSK